MNHVTSHNRARIVLAIAFVLAPMGVVFGGHVWEAMTLTFVVIAAAAMLTQPTPRPAAFMLVMAALWMAVFRTQLLDEVTTREALLYAQAKHQFWVLFAGLTLWGVLNRLKDGHSAAMWANAVCLSALLMVVWTLLQGLGLDPLLGRSPTWNDPSPWRLGALAGHPNFLAAYLAVCAPMFCRPGWWKLLPAVVVVLLLQRSSGGVVAAAAGLGYVALVRTRGKRERWIALALLAGGLIAFVVAFDSFEYSLGCRLAAWRRALIPDSISSLLFGHGAGSWSVVAAAKTNSAWTFNEYLQVYFEMGALGLGLTLCFILPRLFVPPARDKHGPLVKAAFIALAVNCLVNPFFRVPATAMLGLVILSLHEVVNERSR